MESIINHIQLRQKETASHPFIQLLSNNVLPGEQRLNWMPCLIPFVLNMREMFNYILELIDGINYTCKRSNILTS